MTDKALQRANELMQRYSICECGHHRWSDHMAAGHSYAKGEPCLECDCPEFRRVRFTVHRHQGGGMNGRLTTERLVELIATMEARRVHCALVEAPIVDTLRYQDLVTCLRELLDRRAADPTPAQRAWYRWMAEMWGESAAAYTRHCDVSTAVGNARLAAHFGRLAMGVALIDGPEGGQDEDAEGR